MIPASLSVSLHERKVLVRLVVHEDLRYFSCKMKKDETISVQGDARKATKTHQEANQQVETPARAKHAVVLLRRKELRPRPEDQLPEQQSHLTSSLRVSV